MVLIPPGTFTMGDSAGIWSGPVVKFTIDKPFCIDQLEVRVADYARCVETGVCTKPRIALVCNHPDDTIIENVGQHPQNCIDWNQSSAYCGWVGKRLPTEPEWEYAARGTDARIFPWGNEPPDATQIHWGGAGGKRKFVTAPVGTHPRDRSAFGVLDMAGNVSEWTAFDPKQFAWDELANGQKSDTRPIKGSDWSDNDEGGQSGWRYLLDFEGELGQSSSRGVRCVATVTR